MASNNYLTWSRVPWRAVVVRPRLAPVASIHVVAGHDVVAVVRCAPVASSDIQRFQSGARVLGFGVLQRRRTCRHDVAPCDLATRTFVPLGTVKTHGFIARRGFLLFFPQQER